VLLQYGDDPEIEPGDLWVRVLLDADGPEDYEETLTAFDLAGTTAREQFTSYLAGQLREIRLVEYTFANEPVKLSRDKVARVIQAWVEKPVLLYVGLRAGRVVLHVDTDELDVRWLELPRSNRQGRCFLLADRTP
jgi:hypothetical protein